MFYPGGSQYTRKPRGPQTIPQPGFSDPTVEAALGEHSFEVSGVPCSCFLLAGTLKISTLLGTFSDG